MIIAARAKYAAGWDWPVHPDVFHDDELRRQYYAMWSFVAARYSTWTRVAGYEIMSEPRSKVVPQAEVMVLEEPQRGLPRGSVGVSLPKRHPQPPV